MKQLISLVVFLFCKIQEEAIASSCLYWLRPCNRQAFYTTEHAVAIAIFFDFEKLTTIIWKYGIMEDLQGSGLRGRLPTVVEGFLKNRQFQVCSNFSQLYDQEMGIPQGSILSVTLFGQKINSVIQ